MPVDIARVGAAGHTTPLPWILPLVMAGGALLAAGRMLGGPLALPVLSVALLMAGLIVAACPYLIRRHSREAKPDAALLLAGALVLLGFAAALLSDGDGALIALDGMHGRSTVAAK